MTEREKNEQTLRDAVLTCLDTPGHTLSDGQAAILAAHLDRYAAALRAPSRPAEGDAVEKLRDLAHRLRGIRYAPYSQEITAIADELAALRAPASEGEAVLWQYRIKHHTDQTWREWVGEISPAARDRLAEWFAQSLDWSVETRDLFTHPAPATVTEAMSKVLANHGSNGKAPETMTEEEFYERRGMEAMEQAITAALGGAR